MRRWSWWVVFGLACNGGKDGETPADADTDGGADTDASGADLDGDGFAPPEDCDEGDAGVNPAADEVCDGVDNDCDGTLDLEPVAPSYYADDDADGYGDAEDAVGSCFPLAGRVLDDTDCDDTEFDVNPGHPEWCNDRDDDCNPATDETGLVALEGIGNYPDIQAAIDAAVSGGLVDVCAGTYGLPLITGKAITLLGRGADVTILDTAGFAPVLRIVGGDLVRLENLTMQNGFGDFGGCLSGSLGELEIVSSRFSGCTAAQGGAVFFEGDRVTLTDTEVLACAASGEGGAIYAGNNTEVWMTGGRVEGNAAVSGGAGYGSASSDFDFDGVTVTGNTAVESGGAFDLRAGSTLLFTGGALTANAAEDGGAVFLHLSRLDTVGADLGSALDDNAPDDVFQVDLPRSYAWDGVIDVSCAPSVACTP